MRFQEKASFKTGTTSKTPDVQQGEPIANDIHKGNHGAGDRTSTKDQRTRQKRDECQHKTKCTQMNCTSDPTDQLSLIKCTIPGKSTGPRSKRMAMYLCYVMRVTVSIFFQQQRGGEERESQKQTGNESDPCPDDLLTKLARDHHS